MSDKDLIRLAAAEKADRLRRASSSSGNEAQARAKHAEANKVEQLYVVPSSRRKKTKFKEASSETSSSDNWLNFQRSQKCRRQKNLVKNELRAASAAATTKSTESSSARQMLSLSATDLIDLDIVSKSDPIAVVYLKKANGVLEEIGRTEVILNNLHPTWIAKIHVSYQFEIVQPLVFHIYDIDTKHHNMAVKALNLLDQDFIGKANCYLSEIVTKRNRTLSLKLQNKELNRTHKNTGTLIVHAEDAIASREAVEITFRCRLLENKDLFSRSDPFLRISRKVEGGEYITICKTEVVKNKLNPAWKPVCLTAQHYGSKDNPLIIQCLDFNSDGNHTFIGQLQTSISSLQKLHTEKSAINFVKPRHGQDKVLKGQLFADVYIEKQLYSFLDYISSGFELSFMVAIDFIGSNGNPINSDSLHYIDPSGRRNAYQHAITEVGEILQFYDSDRRFNAWGFGGQLTNGSLSHCFDLNGSGIEVLGVEGIMAAYTYALQNVSLSGPTLFSKVINKAAEMAGHSLQSSRSKYYVLLIITDGVLTDLQETVNALVKASDVPLSILIVGVGDADFTQMEVLDADNGKRLESSTGRIASRDIVQFVPMREVQAGQKSVVQSLMEELPGQFLSYMRSRDIKPLNLTPDA